MPNNHSPSNEEPRWVRVARAVYSEQFDGRNREEIHEAMDAWGEDGEELFILSHLGFLNLLAQRDILNTHRDILDGIAELIDQQKRSREVLVKLGRLLKQELGELAELLDEEEEDEPVFDGEEDEDELVEPDAVLAPEVSSPVQPSVLEHPVPEPSE